MSSRRPPRLPQCPAGAPRTAPGGGTGVARVFARGAALGHGRSFVRQDRGVENYAVLELTGHARAAPFCPTSMAGLGCLEPDGSLERRPGPRQRDRVRSASIKLAPLVQWAACVNEQWLRDSPTTQSTTRLRRKLGMTCGPRIAILRHLRRGCLRKGPAAGRVTGPRHWRISDRLFLLTVVRSAVSVWCRRAMVIM